MYFDLKKAFDSVPHIALLRKLAYLNLNPCLYCWIANYLCQRTQAVGVNGLAGIQLSDGILILFAGDIVSYLPIRDESDFVTTRRC